MDGYAFEAQVTEMIPIGLVPAGLRMDAHFEGHVTEGPLAGALLTGVDYLLFRRDGVAVIDARELIRPSDSAPLAITAHGYVVAPFEVPPLEMLLDPDFQWPDAESAVQGAAMVQTMAPALADANRTVYGFTGAVNPATGLLKERAHSLASLALA